MFDLKRAAEIRRGQPPMPAPERSTSPARIETTHTPEVKPETPSVDTIMVKQLKEFSEKGDRSKVREAFVAGPQMSQSTDTSKVTAFSSSVTDASSTLTGHTSTTERSNDLTSEVESGAEDSEKQTTSDTDGEKYTGGATDSGDADTQEEGQGKCILYKNQVMFLAILVEE